eukprot:m.252214 g.252214  ORF g.252214 m.252214 type:complete len:330 (-) comp19560_c0_seq1:222-1211(-)
MTSSSSAVISNLREDLYANSPKNDLLRHWLSLNITRKEAEEALAGTTVGTFIVRRSTSALGDYAVTVSQRKQGKQYVSSYKVVNFGCGQVGTTHSSNVFSGIEPMLEHFYGEPFPDAGAQRVPLLFMYYNPDSRLCQIPNHSLFAPEDTADNVTMDQQQASHGICVAHFTEKVYDVLEAQGCVQEAALLRRQEQTSSAGKPVVETRVVGNAAVTVPLPRAASDLGSSSGVHSAADTIVYNSTAEGDARVDSALAEQLSKTALYGVSTKKSSEGTQKATGAAPPPLMPKRTQQGPHAASGVGVETLDVSEELPPLPPTPTHRSTRRPPLP